MKVFQVYLCRNSKGELDPNGYIWGAPYRWGTMVIAYKKNKFQKHKMSPIEVIFLVMFRLFLGADSFFPFPRGGNVLDFGLILHDLLADPLRFCLIHLGSGGSELAMLSELDSVFILSFCYCCRFLKL